MKHIQSAVLFGVLVLTLSVCKSGRDVPAALPEQKPEPKPVTAEESAHPSPWLVTTSRNEVTGEETVVW
jgi:hypothetical protein